MKKKKKNQTTQAHNIALDTGFTLSQRPATVTYITPSAVTQNALQTAFQSYSLLTKHKRTEMQQLLLKESQKPI